MIVLETIFFFLFGTLIGSFLNVVILRYGTGRLKWRGRSSCPNCRHELEWFELVPIISFLILKGRCRNCRSKISWQYPTVEFFTGLIFAATFLKYSIFDLPTSIFLILDLIIFSLLIIILVYDLRHKIIPDGPVYTFIFLSLFKFFLIPNLAVSPLIKLSGETAKFDPPSLLSGPIMFLPFFLLWYFSRGRWMGFGDAKLALGIGWFLGFFGALSAIILGFWIGAAVGIILLLIRAKNLTIKSEIPFAPFLIIGLWLVYFFQINVLSF